MMAREELRLNNNIVILFSRERGHWGITKMKQRVARTTGIPTSKAGFERKIGKIILNALCGKK